MKDRLGDLADTHSDVITAVEPNAFLDKLLSKVDEVYKLIERISLSVSEVKLRHGIVLTEIDPPKHVREELEQICSDIKQKADVIRIKLKDLEEFSECENPSSSTVYCRIQSSQHTSLSLRFAEVIHAYNQELMSFQTRSKEQIQRRLEISGRVITDEEAEDWLRRDSPAVFASDTESGITAEALREVEVRHRDLLDLEVSIHQLHDMFTDIAALVISQGEMANNIEKAVMQTENHVDHVKENIEKAKVYKGSWGIRLPPFFSSSKSKAKPPTSKSS